MHPAYAKGYAEVMTKFAEVTEEDIAAALAGSRPRDIGSDEIQAYATQQQQQALEGASKRPGIGAGVGGGLGALAGGLLGRSRIPGGALAGAGVGALAGGGLGYGLGALSRSSAGKRGKEWGSTLGGIAQEGKVPRTMPSGSHEQLVPYAKGIQEDTAKPLTPGEFAMIRSGLMKELMTERGIEGALSGAAMGGAHGDSDNNSGTITGAALGGGQGTLQGMREARQRAGTLSDLYERGYGHLAGRMYEGQ